MGCSVVTVGFLIGVLAQSATVTPPRPSPAAEELPISLDRIKRGLAAPQELQIAVPEAIFKVAVEARPLRLEVPWKTESGAPWYVRTPRTLYHHEFLSMVTPEAFRSGVLYPMGFNVLSVLPALRKAFHEAREAEVRAEVEAELREYERRRRKN